MPSRISITGTTGVLAGVDAQAVFSLFETLDLTKILREADIFLTNGQPGWYSEGEVQSYVSASVTTASVRHSNNLTLRFVGVPRRQHGYLTVEPG